MNDLDTPVTMRMQTLVSQWQSQNDQRYIFLDCYLMMTRNMLKALAAGEFNDPAWVGRLLEHFADYYFNALEDFERERTAAPAVWQVAFDSARDARALALQKLLLGVNAHINYDLVFTVVELLRPEWDGLSETQRQERQVDYTLVNTIIARTVDDVQDQVLEPVMPLMEVIDRLFGSLDELLISRLITEWREDVWRYAVSLLEAQELQEKAKVTQQVEAQALKLGKAIHLLT